MLFVWYVSSLDLENVWRTVSKLDLRVAVVLLLLSFSSGFMKYARWESLLRIGDLWDGTNRLDEYLAVNAAFFVGLVTPGTAGELSRGALSRVESPRATAFVALEKITDLGVLTAFAISALALSTDGWTVGVSVLLMSISGGALAFWLVRGHSMLVRRSITKLGTLVGQEKQTESVIGLLRPFKEAIHDPGLVLCSTFFSVILWLLPSLQMYIILSVLNGPVSFSAAALSFLLPYLLGIVSMIPAGIGVFDISAGGLVSRLATAGGPASSVAAPLYFRVFVTIPLVAFGYLCLVLSQSRTGNPS